MNWGPPKPKILESAIEQADRIEIGSASVAPHRAEASATPATPATPVRAKPETRVAARSDEAHAATQATGKDVADVSAAMAVRDTPASEPSPPQPVPAPQRPPSPLESWAREISGAASRTATAAGEAIKARLSFDRTSKSKAAADARPAAEDAQAKAQAKSAGVRWDTPEKATVAHAIGEAQDAPNSHPTSSPFIKRMDLDELHLHSHILPYKLFVLVYLVVVSCIGAGVLVGIESGRTPLAYFDAFFIAVNAMTCTGLTTVNLTALHWGSQVVVALLIQLGSSWVLAAIPMVAHYNALRRRFTPNVAVRNLKVPPIDAITESIDEWHIELKSTRLLLQLIFGSFALVHVIGFLALCGEFAVLAESERGSCSYADAVNQAEPRPCNVAGNAAFLTISAFNNAGFSIEPSSLMAYVSRGGVLTVVALLALAGNLMSPLVIRGAIAVVFYVSPVTSWRRIYAQHLLLSGRRLYSGLLSQQQTTFLVLTQLTLFLLQVIFHHASSPSDFHSDQQAAYMAVQTRHAGFQTVDLNTYEVNVIILFNVCMVLAPTPHRLSVRDASSETRKGRKHSVGDLSDPTGNHKRSSEENFRRISKSLANLRVGNLSTRPNESNRGASITRSRTMEQVKQLRSAFFHGKKNGRAWDESDEAIEFRLARKERVTCRELFWAHAWPPVRSVVSFLASFLTKATLEMDMALLSIAWVLLSGTCPVYGRSEYMAEMFEPGAEGDQCGHTISFAWRGLFELCSAFGNVGLTLGSKQPGVSGVSFSHDLSMWGRWIVLLVALYGRVRNFPFAMTWKFSKQTRRSFLRTPPHHGLARSDVTA